MTWRCVSCARTWRWVGSATAGSLTGVRVLQPDLADPIDSMRSHRFALSGSSAGTAGGDHATRRFGKEGGRGTLCHGWRGAVVAAAVWRGVSPIGWPVSSLMPRHVSWRLTCGCCCCCCRVVVVVMVGCLSAVVSSEAVLGALVVECGERGFKGSDQQAMAHVWASPCAAALARHARSGPSRTLKGRS